MKKIIQKQHLSPLPLGDKNAKSYYLQPKIEVVQVELEKHFATSTPVKVNSVDTNYEDYEDQEITGNELQLF
jgi:hypothetical protein